MDVGLEKPPGPDLLVVVARRFSLGHLWLFLAFWAVFATLTFLIVRDGLDEADRHPGVVAATTVGSVLGPLSGAISRDFQSCCLEFSLSLLPYALGALGLAALVQAVVTARGPGLRALRFVVWGLGLLAWFGSGIVSFGHALG